jgi:hypothetical protein
VNTVPLTPKSCLYPMATGAGIRYSAQLAGAEQPPTARPASTPLPFSSGCRCLAAPVQSVPESWPIRSHWLSGLARQQTAPLMDGAPSHQHGSPGYQACTLTAVAGDLWPAPRLSVAQSLSHLVSPATARLPRLVARGYPAAVYGRLSVALFYVASAALGTPWP